MRALVLALYAEGPSDARFLPPIIRRTAEHLLSTRSRVGSDLVDVLTPLVLGPEIKVRHPSQAERILAAARANDGYHGLIVHVDADGPTRERAYLERFLPGQRLAAVSLLPVCAASVPLIPIHMSEAWMLVDAPTMLGLLGSRASAKACGLPATAREAEFDADPKATLADALRLAATTRQGRGPRELARIYGPLGEDVPLARLRLLTAYRQFEVDLLALLVDVGMAL